MTNHKSEDYKLTAVEYYGYITKWLCIRIRKRTNAGNMFSC